MAVEARRQAGLKEDLISNVESASTIYLMKGEFYPRPASVGRIIHPSVQDIDSKASSVRAYAASLVGLKKTVGKNLTVSAISRGLTRIVRGI
ncbi:MAG TPA: hypothetical protein ENN13_02350 [Candidatus Altiarchaeales archaeon]|nr:hypothetical protein [Candidatus Altiarchaeales archaeon]